MGMGFAPTWLRQVSPLLHKTTLTTGLDYTVIFSSKSTHILLTSCNTISPQGLYADPFHQLFIPRHNLSFGSRAFRFSAPPIWNKLPLRIRETQSLPAFKRHLKTHFFQLAYPTAYIATHHPTRPDFLIDFGAI